MRKTPILALCLLALTVQASADPAAEPQADPFAQPDRGIEVKPYDQLHNELLSQLRTGENEPLKEKEWLILHRIDGLKSDYPNLKDFQVLETDDGRLLITLRFADGKSVFYDPQKDEMVELDPAQPDKLIPLRPNSDGVMHRANDRPQVAAADYMKGYQGATHRIVAGGDNGAYFFDGFGQYFGNTSRQTGPQAVEARTLYEPPTRIDMAGWGRPGPEGSTGYGWGDISYARGHNTDHFWRDKTLYRVVPDAAREGEFKEVPVGYMVQGTGGKTIFYHGGAFPPGNGDGTDPQQSRYWAMYSVEQGQSTAKKLGIYNHLVDGWQASDVRGAGADRRLDISNYHQTVVNTPASGQNGSDKRTIYRPQGRGYAVDDKVQTVELYRYGPAMNIGDKSLRRYVDRLTGDLYAEHSVRGEVRLVHTGRQAGRESEWESRSPSDLPAPTAYAPAPAMETERAAEPLTAEARIRGLDGVGTELPALFARYFPNGRENDGVYTGFSYRDVRGLLGTQGVDSISASDVSSLLGSLRPGHDDVTRAKSAVILGEMWVALNAADRFSSLRDQIRTGLIDHIERSYSPVTRGPGQGMPSYQEAAVHSLLRMGQFDTLLRWQSEAAARISDPGQLLMHPGGFWAAYHLAGYAHDLRSANPALATISLPTRDPGAAYARLASRLPDIQRMLAATQGALRTPGEQALRAQLTRRGVELADDIDDLAALYPQ